MSDSLTAEVLSDLLNEVAHRHHETFISSDGIDPDRAMSVSYTHLTLPTTPYV